MLIKTLINDYKTKFDKYYFGLLKANLSTSILSKAMIYASLSGGKRIRPFLIYQAAKIAKTKIDSWKTKGSIASISPYP